MPSDEGFGGYHRNKPNNDTKTKNTIAEVKFHTPLEDLVGSRRGLQSYLEDLKNKVISYREYDFSRFVPGFQGQFLPKLFKDGKFLSSDSYDIENYVDELTLTMGEAIADNVLKIGDVDYLIDEAIKRDGPEYFIGDLSKDVFIYNGEEYYILW